jgi:uncharacterized protein (TIGR02145 family)
MFLGGLNKDDSPAILPPGDYPDALNMRTGSSSEENQAGQAETLQGEIEVLLNVNAEITYYGEAIGGDFIYTGYGEQKIGDQVWMKKNWDFPYPGSKIYDNDEVNRAIYGGLYTWTQMMAPDFCPPGWHIPSMAEINALITYLGGDAIAGGRMKEPGTDHWYSPNEGADDQSGFKGLPGGMLDSIFKELGSKGKIWISNESGGLRDIDGNEYTVVTIGSQQWIIENFRAIHYANGVVIPNLITDDEWIGNTDYDDWFLPSKDEAVFMVNTFDDADTAYWTSSEQSPTLAWFAMKSIGAGLVEKSESLQIKAIRYFDSTTIYSVGDTGQGGKIFHIVDLGGGTFRYYEHALGTNIVVWSNINSLWCGGTATALGTGQANTTAIIGQVGHTNSAAKYCNNLVVTITNPSDGYCWYNNDPTNKNPYGALYNWYAINSANGLIYLERGGVQETGWRVPTRDDFRILITALGGDPDSDAIAGGKLKESGVTHWLPPNTGADNSSGFTGVGAGQRNGADAAFEAIMELTNFWTSVFFGSGTSYSFQLQNTDPGLVQADSPEAHGLSVRCVKDV